MRVGADIGSICRKCGDVWHVVIALAGGAIAKVECKQCGARHGYRPPDGETGPTSGGRRTSATRSPRNPRKPKRKPIVEADPTRPRRSFQTSETYAVGDRITHAHFGEGVVQSVVSATKVEILFEVGSKIMVHGRKAS